MSLEKIIEISENAKRDICDIIIDSIKNTKSYTDGVTIKQEKRQILLGISLYQIGFIELVINYQLEYISIKEIGIPEAQIFLDMEDSNMYHRVLDKEAIKTIQNLINLNSKEIIEEIKNEIEWKETMTKELKVVLDNLTK